MAGRAESLREFAEQFRTLSVDFSLPTEKRLALATTLLQQAIANGAFNGPEWLIVRTLVGVGGQDDSRLAGSFRDLVDWLASHGGKFDILSGYDWPRGDEILLMNPLAATLWFLAIALERFSKSDATGFDSAIIQAKRFLVARYKNTEDDGVTFGELADALNPPIPNQQLLKVVDVLQHAGIVSELDFAKAMGISSEDQWELGLAGAITTEDLRRRVFTISPGILAACESEQRASAVVAAKTPSDVIPPARTNAPPPPANEPPNELLDELTGQQVKLLKFLWTQPHGVSWDSLPRDAFRGEDDRLDDAVKRALERLQQRLNEFYERFQIGIKINADTRRVKLEKPQPTNADK